MDGDSVYLKPHKNYLQIQQSGRMGTDRQSRTREHHRDHGDLPQADVDEDFYARRFDPW